mmetsp:Transcript_2581/g.6303  ORF Transcript_2581/g.6303 Transcript_2581/m.6303 type:complete len:771 (+) Transcript_2581:78-2390(+)|eukprot:CAMPEP_0206216056 /NCGR_PEP_ID=MMETSP0047_2-20121206/2520_1 /ASSEMBLY_ACC=CAM_ASM_000192 /TAXON_ID=195065 /ORGANISM="Chroomonas mesostigmatica_cf, Strain CCMP1168" /LENGTH=770 /DNA_ID=CAMNT_0053638383 /DNA_START=12 /DNA_END=2324 /DNA_ORIENTATION=+
MGDAVEAYRDEVAGSLAKLCSLSSNDDAKLKKARDTLTRISTKQIDGYILYNDVKDAVTRRLRDKKSRDEWYVKYRLLETIPLFIKRGEPEIVAVATECLDHENSLVRQAAVECTAHLLNREGFNYPKLKSRPGSRSNSRLPSPDKQRPPQQHYKLRDEVGLVVSENVHIQVPKGTHMSPLEDTAGPGSKKKWNKQYASTLKLFNSTFSTDAREQRKKAAAVLGGDASALSNVGSFTANPNQLKKSPHQSSARRVTQQDELPAVPHTRSTTRRRKSETWGKAADEHRRRGTFHDIFEMDWDRCEAAALHILLEKMKSKNPQIRQLAAKLLGKSVGPGKMIQAVRAAEHLAKDEEWFVREAAVLALREIVIPGDLQVEEALMHALADQRREVREAAIFSFETAINKGDTDVTSQIVKMMISSELWSQKMHREEWEVRESGIKAIGVIADTDDAYALDALRNALSDEHIAIRRAATYALGQIAERCAPMDMVWTYNNATAQPTRSSCWTNRKWDPHRQKHMPTNVFPPIDTIMKHSPRELLQMVQTTPRGGSMPHLLTTPRMEHLYEGRDVRKVLMLRDKRREEIENLQKIQELFDELNNAIVIDDPMEQARLELEVLKVAGCKVGAELTAEAPLLQDRRKRRGRHRRPKQGDQAPEPPSNNHGSSWADRAPMIQTRRLVPRDLGSFGGSALGSDGKSLDMIRSGSYGSDSLDGYGSQSLDESGSLLDMLESHREDSREDKVGFAPSPVAARNQVFASPAESRWGSMDSVPE